MLLSIDWDNFFTVNNDINIACEKNTEMLVSLAKHCISQKDIWMRPRDKPGMTPAIRKLFRQSKRLHKRSHEQTEQISLNSLESNGEKLKHRFA